MTMPAGKYYVGDLCYVFDLDQWDEICDLTSSKYFVLSGEFVTKSGIRFALHSTAFGDGMYEDNSYRNYDVDSGSIGCVLLSDLNPDASTKNGHIIEFKNNFETGFENGFIFFDTVKIDVEYEDKTQEEYYEDE